MYSLTPLTRMRELDDGSGIVFYVGASGDTLFVPIAESASPNFSLFNRSFNAASLADAFQLSAEECEPLLSHLIAHKAIEVHIESGAIERNR